MKTSKLIYLFIFIGLINIQSSCFNSMAADENTTTEESATIINSSKKRVATEESKKYWYDGTAEITSYKLTQARYGESHDGTAVLVYVTEPFSKTSNTKSDYQKDSDIPALKLNTTKKFNTGIYPYSMMTSTFFPFEGESASLKASSSMQEWCGMAYLEMKNEDKFIFNLNSYFEGESFTNKAIIKTVLEDDIWSLLRLNPNELPTGNLTMIPSLFYVRLMHKEIKAYKAKASLKVSKESRIYTIKYPELDRTLSIQFESKFPYGIINWKETYYDGYGNNKKLITTKAKQINTIKTDYWNKNKNKDKEWRTKLGL